MTQAPIKQSTLIGLPRRSPRDFWTKYFELLDQDLDKKKGQNRSDVTNKKSDIELAVEAFRIPIEGVMQKFKRYTGDDKADDNKSNVSIFRNNSPLEVIVEAATRMKDYSVFKDDTITSTMIKVKWHTVKRHFFIQFLCYCVYLLCACLHANAVANLCEAALDYNLKINEIWENDYDNTWGKIGLITLPIVALMSLHYLLHEIRQFQNEGSEGANHGIKRFLSMFTGYFKSYWNFIDISLHPLQLAGCILFLLRSSGARPVVAIAMILAFVKFLYYCRFWDAFGPLVRMIYRTIIAMGPFLCVIMVLLFGFGMVFKVLESDVFNFRTYPRSFIQATLMMYGEFDGLDDHLTEPGEHWLTVVMLELLLLLVVIVLLNLLIAIMSDTYSEVNANATLEYRLELANIILEVEKSSAFSRTDARLFPLWLHILKPTLSLEADAKNEFQISIEKILEQNTANEKRMQSFEDYFREISTKVHRMEKRLGRMTDGNVAK